MAKSGDRLSVEKMRELARAGAEEVLRRLRAEIAAIEKAFPELASPDSAQRLRRVAQETRTRVSRMSDAARKAASARMKRYWAERRKALNDSQ